MMTKKRSKRMSGLKLFFAVPVILFVFSVFSCKHDESVPLDIIDEASNPELVSDQAYESVSIHKSTQTPQEVWEDKQVFTVVEEMPTFQGADINKFREWVQKNVQYPQIAVENGIQGKVFVMFIVNEDGSVSDIEILRGVDPSLDDEVIRVVKSSPIWAPGKQRGEIVPVKFSISVNFQLQ